MQKVTKLRVRETEAQTELMALVKHPMDAVWLHQEGTGQQVSEDYIVKMSFELNDEVVAEAMLGPGVASDPLTGISLKDAKPGDRVKVSWIDIRGEQGSAETIIK